MTVSLYNIEYVKRLEADRKILLDLYYGENVSPEDVRLLKSPLPPRHGSNKTQDVPR